MKRFLFSLFFCTFFSSFAVASSTIKPALNLQEMMKAASPISVSSEKQSDAEKKQIAQLNEQRPTVSEVIIEGQINVQLGLIQNAIFLKPGDRLNYSKLIRNVKNIQSLGVFSEVTQQIVPTNKGVKVIFKVTENPLIKEIKLSQNKVVSRDAILAIMKSHAGDILSLDYIRSDVEAIQDLYKEKGYFQARIKQVKLPQKEGDSLEITISEGTISAISVTGNTKTKAYVITREMTIKTGDVLRADLLREDLRRIYNLSYFSDLQPRILPTSDDSYDLQIDVTEKPTSGQFSFGAGYSPQTGASIFSDLFWENVMGTGQLISLKGQFGFGGSNSAQNTRFQFKYFTPYVGESHVSFSTKVWSTNGQTISGLPGLSGEDKYRTEHRKGVEFEFGVPLSYEWRLTHAFKWETVNIPASTVEPVHADDRDYEINSYKFGVENDARDVRFNPRDGHYISFDIEKTLKVTSRALDFTRYDLAIRKFIPTVEKQTLALRLDLGLLTSHEINDTVIYQPELYRVGFSDTVRGQDEKIFQAGNKKIVGSVEYRFLFNEAFSMVFFVDAGLAPSTFSQIQWGRDFVVGKGLGVRFTIPGLGPLRVDAGSDNKGSIRIQVNMGQAF
ncbi:MAG: outer membrane protein assembly factor [Candidatus Margulisbacteria bacterium]|nr:outer membrane protein assembly factor [Candidatus Margulisiibacteriota bacterium]